MTINPQDVQHPLYSPLQEAERRGWSNKNIVKLYGHAPRHCATWTAQEVLDLMQIVAAGEWGWAYLIRTFGRVEDAFHVRLMRELKLDALPSQPALSKLARGWLTVHGHSISPRKVTAKTPVDSTLVLLAPLV